MSWFITKVFRAFQDESTKDLAPFEIQGLRSLLRQNGLPVLENVPDDDRNLNTAQVPPRARF